MEVEETLGFDEYWRDERFKEKKPKFDAGKAGKHGDNIYKPSKKHSREYQQLPSAHSEPMFGKSENQKNKKRDLKGERVLVSENFTYFGSKAEDLPPELECL